MIGKGPFDRPARLHRCPVPGCRQQVEAFMCRKHWKATAKSLRDQLWRSWDSGRGQVGHQLQTLAVLSATTGEGGQVLVHGFPDRELSLYCGGFCCF